MIWLIVGLMLFAAVATVAVVLVVTLEVYLDSRETELVLKDADDAIAESGSVRSKL